MPSPSQEQKFFGPFFQKRTACLAFLHPRNLARQAWAYTASIAAAPFPAIRQIWPGADPHHASQHHGIYVSFDGQGHVADYVIDQLAALTAIGRRVIFISHSARFPQESVRRVAPHVREIVHRRNWGYDFGAFREGLARLGDASGLHSLLLMNDSCYGPFTGLAAFEARADASGFDLFGITDSLAHHYHLQTYFLRISGRVVRSPAFADFWRSQLKCQPRSMVIFRGEIRLTQDMLRAGFSAGAFCPYETVARCALEAARTRLRRQDLPEADRAYLEKLAARVEAGFPLNPTHFFWDTLLRDFRAPFIKRELLRQNPAGIPGLAAWESALPSQPNVPLDATRRHLRRGG